VYPAYAAACPAGSQPLFFIGVDSNQNPLGDTDGDPRP
jgi:basic membrane protein A and related proteins